MNGKIVKNIAREAMQNASAAYIINKYMHGLLDPKTHVYIPANHDPRYMGVKV
ncbi:MAG: hypothetical protein KJ935_06830 [Candidatus Omnitrophica bacterium]|nr:hypothetical protein [Candidatus Omnitrophota bacterium]